MSEEVLELIGQSKMNTVNFQIALQCGPVLAGIKVSNLLILPTENRAYAEHFFAMFSLRSYPLMVSKEKITYLIYQKELKDYILKKEIKKCLISWGYLDLHIESVLQRFAKKYTSYMEEKEAFPHEMGLLLGYPVEDVLGFIANNGQNALYTGYWKVYDYVEDKKELFKLYDAVTEWFLIMLSKGKKLEEIMQQMGAYAYE